MHGSLEDVIGALERLSSEMAGSEGPPLPALVRMVGRRQALVDRLAAFQPLDPSLAERLGAVVRMGVIIAGRLNVAREALRHDIAALEQMQRFADGLGDTVPSREIRLNARG